MAEDAAAGGWSTIESDEGVFTSLIEQLGVKGVQFEEISVLDEHVIASLSPIYGFIFLFKWIGQPSKDERNPADGSYDNSVVDNKGLFFAAQTIQNACGTQAILSVVLNNDDAAGVDSKPKINIGPSLRDFKDFTNGFPADLRGEALSNSDLIRDTHNTFAKSSPFADETQKDPNAGTEDAFHFIGYTIYDGVCYELDGLQPAPISHGECTPEAFPKKIIEILQNRISRYPGGEVRFNLMAVCRDLRVKAEEFQDFEAVERERAKRAQWDWENALRRHNFVGFTGEVLKGVLGMKLKEGSYDHWVKQGCQLTEKKLKDQRARAEQSKG